MADDESAPTQLDSLLEKVEELAPGEPRVAQEILQELIKRMPQADLRAYAETLRAYADLFQPKRRNEIRYLIEVQMATSTATTPTPSPPTQATPKPQSPVPSPPAAETVIPAVPPPSGSASLAITQADVDAWLADFQSALGELSQSHIFQWSTLYRDYLSEDFEWAINAMAAYQRYPEMLERVHELLAAHSGEIFRKGRRYQLDHGESDQFAVDKSLKGLQRFLDLPIEFYSARLPQSSDSDRARRLRALTSSMLSGILTGYAGVNFGRRSGSGVLAQNPRAWAHALAFITPGHLETLLTNVEPSDFTRGLQYYLVPMVEAIDSLGEGREHMPLPAACQLRFDAGRINIWLKPSARSPYPQLIEVECYLGQRYAQEVDLAEALERGVSAIILHPGDPLNGYIAQDSRLRHLAVVAEPELASIPTTRSKITSLLVERAYRQGIQSARQQPLQANLARAFPIDNPELLRHYLVHRQRVRDLFRTFEGRSGVRLWCSVRRSGKTTAGARLDAVTDQVAVVKQTCDTTGETPGDSVVYKAVLDALRDGAQLPTAFFADLVSKCSDGQDVARMVFVLDEYETLFGRLSAALRRDIDLRYIVVQPLLNQMVAFARSNLIIFLGQQPNAHYILMDQNQLSPYVHQDSFPLFGHTSGEPHEEFSQLVAKVLTSQMNPDVSFIDALHQETGGHPFLTINLLSDFVDWLIEKGRTVAELNLTAGDLEEFASTRLKTRHVSMSREYSFFREASAEAKGELGRTGTPWLHQVYSVMSAIVESSPESLRCTRSEFADLTPSIAGGWDPDRLLVTAADSNFLAYDDNHVWPKIRLLGRIAAASQGRVG